MTEANKRCADCGFLALRRVDDRGLAEAERLYRDNGELTDPGPVIFEAKPVCFRAAADLHKEIELAEEVRGLPSGPTPKAIRAVMQDGRTCGRFYQWTQGLSPKEHLDQLEQRRREQVEADRFERMIETQKQSIFVAAIFGLVAGAISGPMIEGCTARREVRQRNVRQADESSQPTVNSNELKGHE